MIQHVYDACVCVWVVPHSYVILYTCQSSPVKKYFRGYLETKKKCLHKIIRHESTVLRNSVLIVQHQCACYRTELACETIKYIDASAAYPFFVISTAQSELQGGVLGGAEPPPPHRLGG